MPQADSRKLSAASPFSRAVAQAVWQRHRDRPGIARSTLESWENEGGRLANSGAAAPLRQASALFVAAAISMGCATAPVAPQPAHAWPRGTASVSPAPAGGPRGTIEAVESANVLVRLDDGTHRTLRSPAGAAMQVGYRVRLEGERVLREDDRRFYVDNLGHRFDDRGRRYDSLGFRLDAQGERE